MEPGEGRAVLLTSDDTAALKGVAPTIKWPGGTMAGRPKPRGVGLSEVRCCMLPATRG